MKWGAAPLEVVAPAQGSDLRFGPDEVVWHLTLDQVEAHTGRILEKIRRPFAEAGTSTFVFDDRNVLYSKLRPYLNKVVCPTEPGVATTELVPLRPDPRILDRNFLAYYLRSQRFLAFASSTVAGVKMPRVIMSKLREHEVPLPPLSEQRRIVEILDQADALRKNRAEADAKAARILPALFYKMFGDPAKNSMKWPSRRLGDLCQIVRGASPRPIAAYMGGTTPWIKIGDASKGGPYIEATEDHVTEEGASKSVYVPPGSVIVANSGVSCGFARVLAIGGCIHDGWLALNNIDPALEPIYLLALINLMTPQLRRLAPGGTQPNLNTRLMKGVPIPVPPPSLQEHFKGIFIQSFQLGARLRESEERLNNLFDSLANRAFTGGLTARWREAHMKELLVEMEAQARTLEAVR